MAAASALCAAIQLFSAGAHATPPTDAVRLAWVRGEGADTCADGATVAREVTRRLGHDPFTDDATRTIEVAVTRDATRWVARIYFREGDGSPASSREVATEAASCDALTSEAGLAIALGIDPDAPPPPPPTSPPAPTPLAPPEPAPAPPSPVTPPRAAPRGLIRPHGGGVTLRGFGIAGVLPSVSAGGALAIDAHVRGPLRVNVGAFIPADARLFVPAQGPWTPTTFSASLSGGWVEACGEIWPLSRLALNGCLGAIVGLVSPHDTDVEFREPYLVWAGPMLDARATIPIVSPLVLELGIQGIVSAFDPTFAQTMPSTMGRPPVSRPLFQSGSVVGLAYVGLGVQF